VALLPGIRDSLTMVRGRKVCSNAAWVVGELAVAFGDGLLGSTVDRFIPILASLGDNEDCHPNLLENITSTIGRLCLCSAVRVAPHTELFIDNWLMSLHEVAGDEMREQSFRGLVKLAEVNWDGVVAQRYSEFLRAVCTHTFKSNMIGCFSFLLQQLFNTLLLPSIYNCDLVVFLLSTFVQPSFFF
jgi:hypothetical protein